MAGQKDSKLFSDHDVAAMFADPEWAAKFPPVLTPDQAAALVQVPKETLYAWSSQGRLDECKAKVGKHLRIHRNKFLQLIFNGGINDQ
jgi:excisionase family DNA binding protein